jgi:hypothetical protein
MAASAEIHLTRVSMFSVARAPKGLSVAVSAFLLMSLSGASFAADAAFEETFRNKDATGEELVNAVFDLLSNTGSPSGTVGTTAEQDEASRALVKPYIDSAFQLQRASGERYSADTYLPADVDDFEIGDVRETRPADDVLVVRYSVRTTETLPDAALVMSKDKAPRLTVFHWHEPDSGWKLLSHANFNTPVSAICDKDPLVDNGLASFATAEDQTLGESLAEKWFSLLEQGDGSPIMNAQVQGQTAGGLGYTTSSEYKAGKLSKIQIDDVVVTRNGKLIVVSLYAKAGQTVFEGTQPLGTEITPRLLTFLQGDDGDATLIATATFNPPKELPPGTVCVPPGALEQAP